MFLGFCSNKVFKLYCVVMMDEIASICLDGYHIFRWYVDSRGIVELAQLKQQFTCSRYVFKVCPKGSIGG